MLSFSASGQFLLIHLQDEIYYDLYDFWTTVLAYVVSHDVIIGFLVTPVSLHSALLHSNGFCVVVKV